MAEVLRDAVGYAAVKIIRRILGFAHVLDLEAIADPDRRAACERACLAFARETLLHPGAVTDIEAWAAAVARSGAALA